MGNLLSACDPPVVEPPTHFDDSPEVEPTDFDDDDDSPEVEQPKVLVPPRLDAYPVSARYSILESAYDQNFGKFVLESLFGDYFEEANHFRTSIMLEPVDDPYFDFNATVNSPLDHKSGQGNIGKAEFRWNKILHSEDYYNLNFLDICVSNTDPKLLMRSSVYDTKLGLGASWILPVLSNERSSPGDYGVLCIKSRFANGKAGAKITSFYKDDEFPSSAWFVKSIGRLTAGVQYEPKFRSKEGSLRNNLANWSFAVGYEEDPDHLLIPPFICAFEFKNNSQFIASFHQRMVVQRPFIRNTLGKNGAIGITNYIDFGFELQTRVDGDKWSRKIGDSTFQIGASWQLNTNFLVKSKMGPLNSSIALVFKSWWKPSFTFNVSALRDRIKGETSFGFGIQIDNTRPALYESAPPKYVMMTPEKLENLTS